MDSGCGNDSYEYSSAEFFKGEIYRGNAKTVCVPGLNCYSCPAAAGACPIGAFQAVVGSSKFKFSYYITGFLILAGVLLGRFVCGFCVRLDGSRNFCIRFHLKNIHPEVKAASVYQIWNSFGFRYSASYIGDEPAGNGGPIFCKYLCPQGVLEGALPLSIANAGIRAALGKLFTWKAGILVAVVLLSLMFYRPFCKWICPLGAVYALFNKVSLLQMHIDTGKCVSCGKCAGVCKMDVDVVRHPNHTECIRCGACVKECPVEAISYKYGFAEKSKRRRRIIKMKNLQ